MKTKKILAALTACAAALSMTAVNSFAAGLDESAEVVTEETTEAEVIDEDTETEEDTEEEWTEEDTEEEWTEEDTEEEWTEEDTEEETEEETEAETEPAAESSPKTGNAPVALAVIPVALAAAAVVAKKSR